VYKDFRAAVLDILQTQENQEAVLNGVAGIGHGIDDIPGSIVSVDTAPSPTKSKEPQPVVLATPPRKATKNPPIKREASLKLLNGNIGNNNFIEIETIDDKVTTKSRLGNISKSPPVIFVIGGPGSNKTTLCLKAIGLNPGWGHIR
jgi:hypothetical protein